MGEEEDFSPPTEEVHPPEMPMWQTYLAASEGMHSSTEHAAGTVMPAKPLDGAQKEKVAPPPLQPAASAGRLAKWSPARGYEEVGHAPQPGMIDSASRIYVECQPWRRRGGLLSGAAAGASFLTAVLTEIYLCNVCSCQEILRRNGRGQGQHRWRSSMRRRRRWWRRKRRRRISLSRRRR
eukprot:COSAG01_NODE_3107_length_6575_cov_3.080296_3_plen_180_part_00